MSERMNELFTLTQKAQKMELINEEIALGIYLEIFENYTPKISKTYESAIRLLEKRQRFQEALSICDKAIELLKANEISGTIDKFEATHSRLEKKILELNPVDEKAKKSFKLNKYHVIILATLVLIGYLILHYTTPFSDLNVNLEGKESIENGDTIFRESEEEPEMEFPITEDMIQIATSSLLKNTDVLDADIIPQELTLGIAIIIAPGTDKERAEELAELYVEALAGAASATYKELKAPDEDFLGELYDYYDLVITAGTSTKAEDIVAKGTLKKGASSIYWRTE